MVYKRVRVFYSTPTNELCTVFIVIENSLEPDMSMTFYSEYDPVPDCLANKL